MPKSADLEADEAYAFLNVVAPKLEQLRRRLIIANEHLKSADPETARLNAIVESQTAIREFLTGIPHLSTLAEPIEVLLDAVREEPPAEPQVDEVEDDPPPVEAPPPAPPLELAPTRTPAATQQSTASPDAWLRAGTALVVEKLTGAGMVQAAAESYVADLYTSLALTTADGVPITIEVVKDWRGAFTTSRPRAWRGGSALKRKVSARGVNPIVEARARAAEMAAVFKKMAQLSAAASKTR